MSLNRIGEEARAAEQGRDRIAGRPGEAQRPPLGLAMGAGGMHQLDEAQVHFFQRGEIERDAGIVVHGAGEVLAEFRNGSDCDRARRLKNIVGHAHPAFNHLTDVGGVKRQGLIWG